MIPRQLVVCEENISDGDIVEINKYYVPVNKVDRKEYLKTIEIFVRDLMKNGCISNSEEVFDKKFFVSRTGSSQYFGIYFVGGDLRRVNIHLAATILPYKTLLSNSSIGWISRYLVRANDQNDPFKVSVSLYNPKDRRL